MVDWVDRSWVDRSWVGWADGDPPDEIPIVLVVGEKPSVARSFERAMRDQPFLHFDRVRWVFTSTRGHVLDIEFEGSLPGGVGRQAELFTNQVVSYSIDGHRRRDLRRRGDDLRRDDVEHTIREQGRNADFVVLCLDNDLEGERIAEEVESILMEVDVMRPPRFRSEGTLMEQLWRCRFSSLDQDSLQRAMAFPPSGTLQQINRHFAEAVGVRRELDLRLGFAFSRAVKHLVWDFLRDANADDGRLILRLCQGLNEEDQRAHDPGVWPVLSYGPCQIPTLGFVERSTVDTSAFQPKPFWKVRVSCRAGSQELEAWSEEFRQEDAAHSQAKQLGSISAGLRPATVLRTPSSGCKKPVALNTTRMLQLASECLGLSPSEALDLAETLYLAEFITYPRSETTAYDCETDLEAVVRSCEGWQHGAPVVRRFA
mmetsp:Transcript_42900/g.113571  ORF Transcript_42900/g.113571 Transcript_42900/m.113571 type:complete len:428 (-) Transcript_42900:2186-3469(-)